MPMRVVEAYSEGELVESYPISLDIMGATVTDADFIEEAKSCMKEDGLSPSLVDEWRVRMPTKGE